MLDVSVVVPTCRRPDLLGRCLSALLRQSLEYDRYEIIVADDAASTATLAEVEQCRSRASTALRYVAVRGEMHGPAAARNAGWRIGSAPVIAFTDDDTVPTREWLERALEVFGDPGIAAASGRVIVPIGSSPTDYERDAAGLEAAGFVTANCLVRRDVLEAIAGFDEHFAVAWREDTDLYFRLLEQHRRVAHAPTSVVVHPVRPARWGVSIAQQRKASYDALLYKKHPVLYAEYVRPGRPVAYYAIVCCLVAVVVGVLIEQSMVTLLASFAWLTFTSDLVARRLRNNSLAAKHVIEMVVTSVLIPPVSLFWRAVGGVRHRVPFY